MKNSKINKYIAVTILLGLAAFVSSNLIAKTYKWVDDHNQTHYGQTPPDDPNIQAEVVRMPSSVTRDGNSDNNGGTTDLHQLTSTMDAAQAAQLLKEQREKDLATIADHNCLEAKKQLQSLQTTTGRGDRVSIVDANGQKRFLLPDERAAYTAKARLDVEKYCSKSNESNAGKPQNSLNENNAVQPNATPTSTTSNPPVHTSPQFISSPTK